MFSAFLDGFERYLNSGTFPKTKSTTNVVLFVLGKHEKLYYP